jgi:integrase
MGRDYKLTWRDHDQRWQKVYKGRTLYFPGPGGKKASYSKAWQAFLKVKAEIDGELSLGLKNREVVEHIERIQATLLEHYHDNQETREHWKALEAVKVELGQVKGLKSFDLLQIAQQRAKGLRDAYGQLPKVIRVQGEEVHVQEIDKPSEPAPWESSPDNLEKLLGQFLADRKREIQLGQLSMARYDNQQRYLKRFVEFLGPKNPISRLDSQGLSRYLDWIKDEQTKGSMSSASARDRLQAAKQLTQWAYSRGDLQELPRCLTAKRGYSVTVTTKEPESMTREEINTFYTKATDRTRLYLLLGINCAMTSADLSTLRRDEIDLKSGTITRKRSKTNRAEGVPVVIYKLWPETLALLRQEMATEGEKALLTSNGKELVQQTWRADGSVSKNDTTHSAWVRLQDSAGISKPHKLLRKTGATMLNHNNEFARFHSLYLGHSPRGMAEKHYAQADQAGFEKALEWLRDQFSLKIPE